MAVIHHIDEHAAECDKMRIINYQAALRHHMQREHELRQFARVSFVTGFVAGSGVGAFVIGILCALLA